MYNYFFRSLNYFRFFFSLLYETLSSKSLITNAITYLKNYGLKGVISRFIYLFKNSQQSGFNYMNTANRNQIIYQNHLKQIPNEAHLLAQISVFTIKPLVSILIPTYNSNAKWLRETIESVQNQIYPNWEVCIADDASTNKECISILQDFQREDSRIKVVYRTENGHISNASNSALEIASGEYIALLDHDDILPKDALFWIAEAINKNPSVRVLYSDEDKIDIKNNRRDPYFKCDWNYSLFLSQNLISHLGVYQTELIRKIGGFRKGFEGSQDYDLALRCIENITFDQIVHIPRVLYHWRIHNASTALRADRKPYAVIAAKAAIEEHLNRQSVLASVEILQNQMYRVQYHLPKNPPLVSIIIPSKNNVIFLRKCLDSILEKTSYQNYEILIVDNNSDDSETLKYLNTIKGNPKILILRDTRDFNYSAINNLAVESANGDIICFQNDDTEVISSNWLGEMLSIGLQQGVGAVGAKLWYPNETLQHGGIILGIGGIASHAHKSLIRGNGGYFNRADLIQEFSAVTGACLLISKSLFKHIGGFNDKELIVAFNDVDLCLRIRELGYRIVWTPFAELYHHESISRGEDINGTNKKRFHNEINYMNSKWSDWIKNDPAYSPNLTMEGEDFSFAWPPRIPSVINKEQPSKFLEK